MVSKLQQSFLPEAFFLFQFRKTKQEKVSIQERYSVRENLRDVFRWRYVVFANIVSRLFQVTQIQVIIWRTIT